MNPLEAYLTSLRDIRSSGAAVDETSYYGALEALFNEVGKSLKPKVRGIPQLKNRGVGSPDIGFYTEDQYKNKPGQKPLEGQSPARGVVEVKPTSEDAWVTADGEQVSRYWSKYRQVLVTNYRDFVFVGQDPSGKPVKLETYRLADSEANFWAAAAHPKKTNDRHGEMFVEFAKRAMLHAAPLTTPQDLAWFLASYARDALARISLHELPALANVRKALEEALGLTFEGEKGEHFFRSTLVQTLFYGVFSAWVLWSKQRPPTSKDRFDWTLTSRLLRVPVLRKLFHEVADPGQLEDLNLAEILDWTSNILNRVDRASFFAKFEETHAVQYFYEPFLQAYDPDLRKQLGVWYTPPEIVQYMVARVDTVLREELNLPDGLADKNVYVLDPCCGTGSYLVEVLKKIHETLKQRGDDALIAADLKEAAKNRVFGFEILPAPFVVSHLQLGLLLQNLGAPLAEKGNERIGVFLTNALTGWEPPKEPKTRLLYKELEEERDAAEHVKRDTPILVILGNPPYNSFAGVAVKEERALTEAYKFAKRVPAPQGQGLNDLYVRFFRMAERRIVEKTGRGIVCFISNYSWLESLSCTAMRERYLEVFDQIWIDNLHGDRIISEYAPDGRTSETVFAMRASSPGITIGTAVSLLSASPEARNGPHSVFYRDFDTARAEERRAQLLASLKESKANAAQNYQKLVPLLELGLPLKPRTTLKSYLAWPSLTALFPTIFPGVKTSRDDFLVDIDRESLIKRLKQYFDKEISNDAMYRISPTVMSKTKRFDPHKARGILLKRGFLPNNVVRYVYRPFDLRWLYWEPETKLLDEKRSEYFPHVSQDNLWAVSQQKPRREWSQPQAIRSMGCLDLMDRGASCIPLFLKSSNNSQSLLPIQEPPDPRDLPDGKKFNISDATLLYLSKIGTVANAEDLFYHSLATMHAPAYRTENAGGLRQDWPRIPLTNSKEALLNSSALGRSLGAILDPEASTKNITVGEQRPELKLIGTITRAGGGSLEESDLWVRAGWGHSGKRGATMPSKGKLLERDYSQLEHKHILEGASRLGLSAKEAITHLGEKTCDVYLNDVAYWSNIPVRVWDYTIGGYQVIKKWLSYREKPLLGRPLSKDEVRYVQEMARRIAAILLLEPALDANYEAVKQNTYKWPPA
jgi:Type ISP C-terminal specificity domain/N-6 DNA Methylase